MKIKITRKGVHDKDGKPVAIGTEIDIKGDSLPASFVNKCEILTEKKAEKAAVTSEKGGGEKKAE